MREIHYFFKNKNGKMKRLGFFFNVRLLFAIFLCQIKIVKHCSISKNLLRKIDVVDLEGGKVRIM